MAAADAARVDGRCWLAVASTPPGWPDRAMAIRLKFRLPARQALQNLRHLTFCVLRHPPGPWEQNGGNAGHLQWGPSTQPLVWFGLGQLDGRPTGLRVAVGRALRFRLAGLALGAGARAASQAAASTGSMGAGWVSPELTLGLRRDRRGGGGGD